MENISYSTVGFSDRDIESALDAIAEAGFPLVEIQGKSPHVAEPLTGKMLSDFKHRIHTRGLTARTMHAPSGRTVLGTTDEDWRRQEIILLKRYLNFGSDLGITDMVIHPIPNPIFVENPENPNVPDLIGESLKRSIDDLIPTAERTGVRFNLENLPALYHCEAGTDRTGVISALILGVCGVEDELIAEDYGLSAKCLIESYFKEQAPPNKNKENYTWLDYQNEYCSPRVMLGIMDYIQTIYGGTENYIISLGINKSTIETFKGKFLSN